MSHVEIIEIPAVPFGPDGDPRAVDAMYYREAARNIRWHAARGKTFAGSNLTETVAKLCEAAASALERPAFQPFDSSTTAGEYLSPVEKSDAEEAFARHFGTETHTASTPDLGTTEPKAKDRP